MISGRCRHRLRGTAAILLVAVVAGGAALAQDNGDIHRYQKFRMVDGSFYNLVDFHYESQTQCEDANRRSTALFRTRGPDMTLVTEACLTGINDIGRAMMANRPTVVPYFSFQDLRIWLSGAAAEGGADLRLCRDLSTNPVYAGGRCIP
ncbi:hypothetical protein [Roseospira visakhapatnamensis]|uniref:Uncharacterized protein n=1 Tax=Roseospira visakhapatnamensis TaxID=390880 RepID=A0A7W6RAP1_9PROT|nr:hypothetical protein [Roseospira visakhapatnamensis]MBB4264997.1 hypothetical protein [Roseospira visakhapatnamensis]